MIRSYAIKPVLKKWGPRLTIRNFSHFLILILHFSKFFKNKKYRSLNTVQKKMVSSLCYAIKKYAFSIDSNLFHSSFRSSKDFMGVLLLSKTPKTDKDFVLIFSFIQHEAWINSETFHNKLTVTDYEYLMSANLQLLCRKFLCLIRHYFLS